MSIRNRTSYSFRNAIGNISENHKKITEICGGFSPLTDTASVFGFTRWSKLCKKANSKPIFGIELAVAKAIHDKKPGYDYWTFIAKDDLRSIHELLYLATQQFRYVPILTLTQANAAQGVFKIAGSKTNYAEISDDVLIGLSPSMNRHQLKQAVEIFNNDFLEDRFYGVKPNRLILMSDNRYLNEDDRDLYQIQLGRDASVQTYPQHLMTDQELLNFFEPSIDSGLFHAAVHKRDWVFEQSNAIQIQSVLLTPEKPKTLEQMCIEGAEIIGCNLNDSVYKARLKRELDLIEEKKFEDYFYIVADICQWARQRMIVGPARGSSCGSLVCYLLQITTVDPIPHGLLFERFIDINRSDLPDIDIDFSDTKRQLVFDYMAEKFGNDRVARLGTVALFRPRSVLQNTAAALDIPRWKIDKVVDGIIERSGGDSRALQATEDTLRETSAGRELLNDFPEMLHGIKMEGEPTHFSQHAAGMVITDRPIMDYVGLDSRTGAMHCDKKDAEDLGLLKIDALGLTQLSVFEDCLQLAGLPMNHLFKLPFDDKRAFDVLNKGHYSGIFQFNGLALQSVTDQVEVTSLNDIVSITALARPGPLNAGGTNQWIKVKTEKEPLTYSHPIFEKYLQETLGIVTFQEQVMVIGREVGGLSWEDVSALRKAMSKSLGTEFFDQYGIPWKKGAIANGVSPEVANKMWTDLCSYGAMGFNKCLTGDTLIRNATPNHTMGRFISIEKLHSLYVENPSISIKRYGLRPCVYSLDENSKVVRQKIKEIHANGPKHCWEFSFEDGSTVSCTEDHKFIINGNWKKASESKVGDEWTSIDHRPLKKYGSDKGIASRGKKWINAAESRHGANNPAYQNGKTEAMNEFKIASQGKPCADCSENHQRMEAHHGDFNGGRDRPKDLTWLCPSCHKKRHYAKVRTKRDQLEKRVFSKIFAHRRYIGMKETYDIEMPTHHNFELANGLITHNSHAVAYGIVSYWCCWLKAYHPVEFAAATLSHTETINTQISMLREMHAEGIEYVPVDAELSELNWTVGFRNNSKLLVGPLSAVKGIGPKAVANVLSARARGEPLTGRVAKLLANPVTEIDNLWPIEKRFTELMPSPAERNIFTAPKTIRDCQVNGQNQEVMVFCTISQIKPKDENEEVNVQKRGYRFNGATQALNLRLTDDTDTVFAKVDRFNYAVLGLPIVERGRAGKALYAIKGTIPPDFRMIKVSAVRYIGDMENDK